MSQIFWAKSHPGGYHPLIAHSADVAAVMAALVGPGSAALDRLSTTLGEGHGDPEALRRLVTYLAGLHDIGKANHGFQDQAGPLAHPGSPRWLSRGHVQPLLDTLEARVHIDVWRDLLRGLPWAPDELGNMLGTAVAHHGRPVSGRTGTVRDALAALWDRDPRTGRDPLAEIDRIAGAARRWAGLPVDGWASEPFPWTPALSHLFAGLLVTADWIGSSPDIFPFRPEADADPYAYWVESRDRAEAAVREIGLRPPDRRLGVTGSAIYRAAFPSVFGSEATPTVLQEHLAKAPLPSPGSRIFVESDTGSGKTEAILAFYARLRDAGRADGIVFALPSRATATAMRERIQDCLGSLHPGDAVPTVALAMGGDFVRAGGSTPPLREGEIHDEDEPGSLREWASEHAKRFFAAEVVVGTVDQLLLAGLPVRHAHHRLGLLSRHFIVVDELHSYDRYMVEVLRRVCDFHASAGGMSAYLSATLSSTARHQLVGEGDPTTLEEAQAAPYPAIFVRSPDGWDHEDPERSGNPRALCWATGGLDEGLEQAIALAREGARVCVLRNTVGDVRATFAELEERVPDLLWRPRADSRPACVHSRYIGPDRNELDRALLKSFGKESSGGRGAILVSTQVVEQSLDVDFDWMLTDLAPIDVLLQRAGRVHRHQRAFRPHSVPVATLFVHAPKDGFEPRLRYRGPHGWGTVYPGLMDLELTRRTIGARPSVQLPTEARRLIEGVYHQEARERMVEADPEWDPVEVEESGQAQAAALHGAMASLDFTRSYMELAERFKGAEDEKIRTRVGDDQLTVGLDRPVLAWHARRGEAREVAMAVRHVRKAEVDLAGDLTATWREDTDVGSIFEFGRLTLRYGPTGWHW